MLLSFPIRGASAGVGRFPIQCLDGSADWTGKSRGVHGRHRCRRERTFSVHLSRRGRFTQDEPPHRHSSEGDSRAGKNTRRGRYGRIVRGTTRGNVRISVRNGNVFETAPAELSRDNAWVRALRSRTGGDCARPCRPGSRIAVDPRRARFRRAHGGLGGFVRGGVSFLLDPALSRTIVQSRKNGVAYGEKKEGRRTWRCGTLRSAHGDGRLDRCR